MKCNNYVFTFLIFFVFNLSLSGQPLTGWERPGPCNTGPYDESLLVPSGTINVNTDGAVIENVDVSGIINIYANNVTIRNFRINANTWYAIRCYDGAIGLVVEDGEILNIKASSINPASNFTARRIEVHESEGDAFKAGDNAIIESCWMHNLGTADGAHADAVQITAGSNIIIRGNFMDAPDPQPSPYKYNAALIAKTDFGAIDNVLFEDNWADGGNYTVYVRDGGSGCPTNVTVRNNHFGGNYVYGLFSLCGTVSMSGNFEDPENVSTIPDCGQESGGIEVTGVSISPSTLSLVEGATANLTESIQPTDATNQAVNWSSNNTSVATVDGNGVVVALNTGQATITVTTVDGGLTDNCTVTVTSTPPPTGAYYCDPVNGSMSNNGSESSPWASLEAVFSAGKSFDGGDVIYLMSGNHGFPIISESNTANVTITKYGSDSPVLNCIKFNGASHWVVRDVKINPETPFPNQNVPLNHPVYALYENSMIQASGASDITIDNCSVISYDDISSWIASDWNSKAWNGAYIKNGCQDITIVGCHIKNVNFGLEATGSSGIVIENSIVENFCGDGLRPDCNYSIIQNNVIKNSYETNGNHDDLIQIYTGGNVTGTIIRNNKFFNYTDPAQPFKASAQGIALFDGMYIDFVIENNLIVTDHWHGLTILGATNCKIINNTVVDINSISPGPAWIQVKASKSGTASTGNIVRNNICTDLSLDAGIGSVDHNIEINWSDYNTYFNDYANFDFSLKESSPAIDAGSSTDAPTIDIDGNPRTGAIDVGCYEYGSGTIIHPTSISVSPSTLILEPGGSSDLTESVLPTNATDKSVTWTSGNTAVATVDNNGLVTGVTVGTCTITATTVDGGLTATCDISVNNIAGDYNLALNNPVSVTSYQDDSWGAYPGSNLVDDDTGEASRWSAAGFPQSATVDLGEECNLSSIEVFTYQSRAYQYVVETSSDGINFAQVIDRSSNTTTTQPIADNVSSTGRYVKISISGADVYTGSWVSLTELRIIGNTDIVVVDPTSISVSPSSLDLLLGETGDLTETVLPANATDKSVTWSSSNTAVATVDANGVVSALSGGQATITVTTVEGGFSANCNVTVTVPVTSVSISAMELSLNEGESSNLDETVSPANATDKTVTWSSSNTAIATVDANGVVSALSGGEATITVTTNEGGFSADCNVTVTVPVTSVSISALELTLDEGETSDLDETVGPANASDKTVTWSSSDAAVATVDANGVVSALSVGQTIITVTTNDGGFTASCDVSVNDPNAVEQTLYPIADTYVRGGVNGENNYGTQSRIDIKQTVGIDYLREGYLKFDLTGMSSPISSAVLRLYVSQYQGYAEQIYKFVSDDSWTETGITYNNKPAAENIVGTSVVNSAGSYIEVDLQSIVASEAGGVLSIQVTASEDLITGFDSREGTNKPELVVWAGIAVSSVNLSSATLSLDEGQSAQLTASVLPVDATDPTVTWSSDNTAVATVSEGLVSAVAPGTATITVTSSNGISDECIVTVNALNPFIIDEDFSSGDNDFTVISGGTWAISGEQYVLTNPATAGNGLLGNISVHDTEVTGDFTLTTQLNITGTSSYWNDAAVIFNYQDANNYYYVSFNESNDGNTKGIFKIQNGVPSELADITNSISSDINYSIEIVRSGNNITVSLDDVQIASVADATFSDGKIGYGTKNDGARYDNLQVVSGAISKSLDKQQISTEVRKTLKVYPNPVSGAHLYVVLPDYNTDMLVEAVIYDLTGKKVYSSLYPVNNNCGMNKIEIPVKELSVSGIYFISVNDGVNKYMTKVMVRK